MTETMNKNLKINRIVNRNPEFPFLCKLMNLVTYEELPIDKNENGEEKIVFDKPVNNGVEVNEHINSPHLIKGENVIGSLPIVMAGYTNTLTMIPLGRGQNKNEMNLAEMKEVAKFPATFIVRHRAFEFQNSILIQGFNRGDDKALSLDPLNIGSESDFVADVVATRNSSFVQYLKDTGLTGKHTKFVSEEDLTNRDNVQGKHVISSVRIPVHIASEAKTVTIVKYDKKIAEDHLENLDLEKIKMSVKSHDTFVVRKNPRKLQKTIQHNFYSCGVKDSHEIDFLGIGIL